MRPVALSIFFVLIIGFCLGIGTLAPVWDSGVPLSSKLPLGLGYPSLTSGCILVCNESGLYEHDLGTSETEISDVPFTSCPYSLGGDLGLFTGASPKSIMMSGSTAAELSMARGYAGPCSSASQCHIVTDPDYNQTTPYNVAMKILTPKAVLVIRPTSPCYFIEANANTCTGITADDLGTVVEIGVIDFNSDGISDLIISAQNGSLWYYKGASGPTWTKHATLNIISGVTNIVAVDIAGNGRPTDFVVIGSATSDIYVYDGSIPDTFTYTAAPVGLAGIGANVMMGTGVMAVNLDAEPYTNDLLWYTTSDSFLYVSYGTVGAANTYVQSFYSSIPFIPTNGVILDPIRTNGSVIIASYEVGVSRLTLTSFGSPTTTPVATTTTPVPTTTTPVPTTTTPAPTTTEPVTTTPIATPDTPLATTDTPVATTDTPLATTEAPTETPTATPDPTDFISPVEFIPTLNTPPGNAPAIDIGEYFTVSYISIIERGGLANLEIQGYRDFNISMSLDKEPTTFPNGSVGERETYSGVLSNGATLRYILWYILEDVNVSFANISILLKKNQLKQGIEIDNWPFRSPTNRLELAVRFGASKPVVRSGFGQLDAHTVQVAVRTETRVLKANFLSVCLIDNHRRSMSFAYDESSLTLVMSFVRFTNSVVIDPDFSVLIADPSNPDAGVPPQKKKSNKNVTIGIAVSMSIIAVIVLGLIVFFVIFWKHPRVRAFVTGDKVQVATIGTSTNRGLLSTNMEAHQL